MIWSMFQKQGNFEGSILCNLYACCKSRERLKKPILKIINFFVESLSDESTFVTYAGDWGIEKNNYDTILKDGLAQILNKTSMKKYIQCQ